MNATIKGFIRKEFIQTLRDPRMRILIFAAPIIQLTIFGYAISNEIRNIRLAASFQPGDVLAERLFERALSSRWFLPARVSGQDPFTWVQSGQADAVLVAPTGGLTRQIQRGQTQVQLLVDATNVLRARAVERYLQATAAAVAADLQPGAVPVPAMTFDIRMLYNPSMETSFFLVPGVMVMLLCIITVLLTSMALVREKELGTFETLIAAPLKNWEILLGKTLPFLVLSMVLVHLILLAAVLLFGLPMRGAYWKFLAAALMFVCSTISVGTFISTIARRQQQAMMATFLFLFPALMLSGMFFPIENMPGGLILVAYLNPLKYMLTLMRNILLKGGDDWVFWSNLAALAVLAVVAVAGSFNRFRQTLN
ncbi:MAG: ABC transporter permease [candidate division FCPU426 bacterium]